MTNRFVASAKKKANEVRTANGAATYASSLDKNVDLFFMIGSRNKDYRAEFNAAYAENPELATRILLWARDIRGGAGERSTFRTILQDMEVNHWSMFQLMLPFVPEVGRWDDLLVCQTRRGKELAFSLIKKALAEGNGLCAKWMPREKSSNRKIATELRNFLGMSPKAYRLMLTQKTAVVENKMCAQEWGHIEYEKVPSLALARYQKAFQKNDPEGYAEFAQKLASGDPTVNVNAGAVFPYDVIKTLGLGYYDWHNPQGCRVESSVLAVAKAQWDALPNYIQDAKILPLVDVSGSMTCSAGGSKSLSCLDVAVSLGLYCAEKNTGDFKDIFVTFTSDARLQHLSGDLVQKLRALYRAEWGGSTNLEAAFKSILTHAVANKVPQEDMPEILLILSDMEFNCVRGGTDTTLYGAAKKLYDAHGYTLPKIVFWNLDSRPGNVPVKAGVNDTALVSGFSPAILKAILSGNMEKFTPRNVMLEAVGGERYNIWTEERTDAQTL